MSSVTDSGFQLDWRSAWRIAGKVAFEVQFRSAMQLGQGAFTQTVEKQIEKARSNARLNKFMVSFFTGMLAVLFGFSVWGVLSGAIPTAPELVWVTVALLVSLFSLMAFGFLLFWGVMISTSFISTGAASIGLYLPLSRRDAGKVALLGFIRLFDAQVITIAVGFPLAYFFATFSITGTIACLTAFLVSLALSITLMLILAIYFHSRIQSSGGSRLGSIIRIFFFLVWALAIMGITLSFNLMSWLLPIIESVAILLLPHWLLLSLLFPFSFGTVVAQVTFIPGMPLYLAAIGTTLLYVLLGILGIRWGANFLAQIGLGSVIETGPAVIQPVNVQVSGVGSALIRKDLRIALRTPGQAVMFFLPVMMMVPILLQFLFESGVLYATDILILLTTPSVMFSFFSIFFLSLETRGMTFTQTLPLKTESILRAKAQLLTIMALTIPVLIFVVSLLRPLTTPVSLLIAASQPAAIYGASFIALLLFTRIIGKGRLVGFELGQHVSQLVVIGLISAFFNLIPLGLYGFTTLLASVIIPLEMAHWVGLAFMWLGIIFNYLFGKLLAKFMLRN